MTTSSTFARLQLLIARMGGVDPAIVLPVARLRGYAIDSLRVYELVMVLEEEFAIQLDLAELAPVITVADLVDFVDARLGHDSMSAYGHTDA
jgi:acyl carrier protein